jgi:HlyD family secretion protein
VRAGDIIARIAPLPLDSQSTVQAQARVDATVALALQADAQVRVANAELAQRRKEYARAQRLAEVGGIAPRAVEECALAQLQAEEAVRAATQRATAADADVRQARAVLSGNSPGAVARVVRAPATGIVLRLAERSERIVTAGTPLMEIGDPGSLDVVVDVLSSDAAAIRNGALVRITRWSAETGVENQILNGVVTRIDPAGFTKTSALGLAEQRVNVIIALDNTPKELGDGFRVEASIITWQRSAVVTAPRSALFQSDWGGESQQWTAYGIRRGRIEERLVEVGHFGGNRAEIISGLAPGDSIVAFPSDRVRVGVRVSAR